MQARRDMSAEVGVQERWDQPAPEQRWLDAIGCDHETRVSRMQSRYWELASEDETRRREALEAMILEELQTEDREYHEITEARLRAWLRVARTDHQAVRMIARSYDAVFARLPGQLEFRRAMAVQAVVARSVSDDDRQTLVDLIPGISRFLPPTRRVFMRPDVQAAQGGGG